MFTSASDSPMTQLNNHPLSSVTVLGNRAKCLTEILRHDVNLAVWQRNPSPCWQSFINEFCAKAGNLERFTSLETGQSAAQALPSWALDIEGSNHWIDDVDQLIGMYQCLFEPEAIGLRIHVLQQTMCPRFHVDRVPVRLLCTYRGPGTEWLSESQVTRPTDGGPLPEQLVQPGQVRQIPTNAVALLKGEAWEGNEGKGLVHRSPAPNGSPRLIIGLDWLSS